MRTDRPRTDTMHQDQGRQGVLPRSNPTHTAIRAARGETNDRDLQGRDCGPIRAVGIGLKTIILPVLRTLFPPKAAYVLPKLLHRDNTTSIFCIGCEVVEQTQIEGSLLSRGRIGQGWFRNVWDLTPLY